MENILQVENFGLIKHSRLSPYANECMKAGTLRLLCGLKDCGNDAENRNATKRWLWGIPNTNQKGIIANAGMTAFVDYEGTEGSDDITFGRTGVLKAIANTKGKKEADELSVAYVNAINQVTKQVALHTMSDVQLSLYQEQKDKCNALEQQLQVTNVELNETKGIINDIGVYNDSMPIEDALKNAWNYDGFPCVAGRQTLYDVAKNCTIIDKLAKNIRLTKPYQIHSSVDAKNHIITNRVKWSKTWHQQVHPLVDPSRFPELYTTLTPSVAGYEEALASIVRRYRKCVQDSQKDDIKALAGEMEKPKLLIRRSKKQRKHSKS